MTKKGGKRPFPIKSVIKNKARREERGRSYLLWVAINNGRRAAGARLFPAFGSVHRPGRRFVCELGDRIPDPASDRYAVVIVGGCQIIGARFASSGAVSP